MAGDGSLTALVEALAPHGLEIAGGFHPRPEDGVPEPAGTLLLIGPGPEMWAVFAASPEAADGAADPMDRWSARVLGDVVETARGRALFPFGGPPWLPFLSWAMKGEGARSSPVGMLVSARRGLWVSYRGAVALEERVPLGGFARVEADPCLGCPAPCLTACPVSALGGPEGYDVAACIGHIEQAEGAACLEGCLARRACPLAEAPVTARRRFHMEAFLAARQAARARLGD